MKKAIEGLWKKYHSIALLLGKEIVFKGGFEQAIEEAMKAQREACVKAYICGTVDTYEAAQNDILNAEVE